VSAALLDTSVVIAGAHGKVSVSSLPSEGAISIVTLCELHHGVLAATDEQRPGRLLTLDLAQRSFEAIPVDLRVAPWFGRLMAATRRASGARPGVADALIAATAMAHGLPVLTCDRDFEALPGVELIFA
jgi:predicted nucleic acid-binding protein